MNENIKIYLLIGTYQFEEGYKIIRAYISRELAEEVREFETQNLNYAEKFI